MNERGIPGAVRSGRLVCEEAAEEDMRSLVLHHKNLARHHRGSYSHQHAMYCFNIYTDSIA